MPVVLDISSSRSPKKSTGKPKPPAGPKPGVLIGLGIAAVLAVSFAVWFFAFRGGASSSEAAPYNNSTRNLNAPAGGTSGNRSGTGSRVAPGLPGG